MVDLRARVFASRAGGDEEHDVLDWRLVGLVP